MFVEVEDAVQDSNASVGDAAFGKCPLHITERETVSPIFALCTFEVYKNARRSRFATIIAHPALDARASNPSHFAIALLLLRDITQAYVVVDAHGRRR